MINFLKNSRIKFLFKFSLSLIRNINLYKPKSPDIVFIWIPKTAGSSIFNSLQEKFGMERKKSELDFMGFSNKGSVTFGHVSYLNLLMTGVVNRKFHNSAYKFCFVRNPYERIISLFNYLNSTKNINNLNFEQFLEKIYLKRPPIGLYNRCGLSQTNPQSDWIIDSNGEYLVNDIFKVEDMKKFISHFSKQYDVNLKIEKLNVSKKILFFQDIKNNKEIIEKIENIYARDFDLFDYQKISR